MTASLKQFISLALLIATPAAAQLGICTNSITTKRGKPEGMNCIGGPNNGNACTGPTLANGWTNDCPNGTCGQFVEYGETDDNFDNVAETCSASLQTWPDDGQGLQLLVAYTNSPGVSVLAPFRMEITATEPSFIVTGINPIPALEGRATKLSGAQGWGGDLLGLRGYALNSSALTDTAMVGVEAQVEGNGILYGMRIGVNQSVGSTVTDRYGLYIQNPLVGAPSGDDFAIYSASTQTSRLLGVLEVDSPVVNEWTPAAWDMLIGNGTDEGQIRIGGGVLGTANETIAGTIFDNMFVFANKNDSVENISFLFAGANDIPRFVIAEEAPDFATYNPRSVLVGPSATLANVDENVQCSTNFNEIDCDTDTTGADLGVEDDVELGGTLYIQPDGTAGPNWALFSGSSERSRLFGPMQLTTVDAPALGNNDESPEESLLIFQRSDWSPTSTFKGRVLSRHWLDIDPATAQPNGTGQNAIVGYVRVPPDAGTAGLNLQINQMVGVGAFAEHYGTGPVSSIHGLDTFAYQADASTVGDIQAMRGFAEQDAGTSSSITGLKVGNGMYGGTTTDYRALDLSWLDLYGDSTDASALYIGEWGSGPTAPSGDFFAIHSDNTQPSYFAGNMRVGIKTGNTSQGYPGSLKTSLAMNVFNESTDTGTGRRVGGLFGVRFNPPIDTTGLHQVIAIQGDTYVSGSNTANVDDLIGITAAARMQGTGDFDKLFGGEFVAQAKGGGAGNEVRGLLAKGDADNGVISRVIGFENEVRNDGATVSNLVSLEITEGKATAGTTSNRYGIRLNNGSDDVGVNNDWAIWSNIPALSYLEGGLRLPTGGVAATPIFNFGDGDTGFYEESDDALIVAVGGELDFRFNPNTFAGRTGGSFRMYNQDSDLTNLTYSWQDDANTGISRDAIGNNDKFSLVAGGVEQWRITQGDSGGDDFTFFFGDQFVLPTIDDSALPALAFGDRDTGWTESADDILKITIEGTYRWFFDGDLFRSEVSNGPLLWNRAATALAPTVLPDGGDLDTGLSTDADDELSVIAGGVQVVSVQQHDAAEDQMTINHILQLTPLASAPACAVGGDNGKIYSDSSGALCFCNGAAWEKIGGGGGSDCT